MQDNTQQSTAQISMDLGFYIISGHRMRVTMVKSTEPGEVKGMFMDLTLEDAKRALESFNTVLSELAQAERIGLNQ